MHVCCILPSPCARPFDLYREMPEFAEFFMEEPIEALLLLTKAIMQVRDVTTATYTVCMCGHVSTAIRTHTRRPSFRSAPHPLSWAPQICRSQ